MNVASQNHKCSLLIDTGIDLTSPRVDFVEEAKNCTKLRNMSEQEKTSEWCTNRLKVKRRVSEGLQ